MGMQRFTINTGQVAAGVVAGIVLTVVLGTLGGMQQLGLIAAVLVVGACIGARTDDEANLMVNAALAGGLTAFAVLVVFPSVLIALGWLDPAVVEYQLVFIAASTILIVPAFAFISVVAGLIGEALASRIRSRWFPSASSGGHTSVSRLNEISPRRSDVETGENGSQNRPKDP